MDKYDELLKDDRWTQRRYEILIRDFLTCKNCNNEQIIKTSKKADVIKQVKYSQCFDKHRIPYGLSNIYKVIINDIHTESSYPTHICLWSELHGAVNISNLNIYYSLSNTPSDYGSETSCEIRLIQNPLNNVKYRTVYARCLHVHHEYYQDNTLPWDYPDDALRTLCWMCHEELHAEQPVKWLNEYGFPKGVLKPCERCYGAGYIPKYSHVENGICFKCNGAKYSSFM